MTFQRIIQGLSLAAFILLLGLAAFPLVSPVTVDAFLVLDPVVFIGTIISARAWVPAFWAGALLLASTPLIGRFFCGTLCPMGTTLDVTDRLFRANRKESEKTVSLRHIKILLLLFIMAAAAVGISFVFLAAPLSLITRLYGLILHPILCQAGETTLTLLRPIADMLDLPAISYFRVATPRYGYQWFTVLLFTGIFSGAWISRRFWCRYLCPAGAAFALLSGKPLVRRNVTDRCSACGLCRKRCPMNAIGADPFVTNHSECITCETCVRACPDKAISFTPMRSNTSPLAGGFSMERRQWMGAVLSGVGAAMITRTSLSYPLPNAGIGQVAPADLMRPPGTRPEIDFLSRCIRCGACMKACPTNTLQPMGFDAGVAAFLSPKVIPRRGPCDPACNVCGQVCPTGAIQPLSPGEKHWAKIGTAQILRHRCLAWEYNRKCLVCDEVCPYDAISLKTVEGIGEAVPFVDETRCSGCGFCEFHCPVQNQAAIEVSPMAAFRIIAGSYQKTGLDQGFTLGLKRSAPAEPILQDTAGNLPPGFTP